ncbi:unnamed protein product [Meganyctiphanes norvegica]|uniref:Uncharacterized protein n=1 Tax=Meganyctiphanes norvegica TaxID=48144 RepID=A0AAV2PSE9_MEGNR
MSVAMSYHELQANLLQLEQEIINQENGPPMAPTILKCNCNLTCECQDCLENPLPLDGSIKIRILSWCPTPNQGQFINCFMGQYSTTFYYTWPCGLSAHCNPPRAPLPKETDLAHDFVQMLLDN